ncbi:MAG: putative chemotaxis signal transduction protein CheW [Acidobacteria bacterium]|nr:putative chemotaxis signal transduction protein CheW [Acidobacteriota bacterium]
MSADDDRFNDLAVALRREFDQSFTRAPSGAAAALVDLLAVGLGGDEYVLRLTDVSGLFTNKTVTWLPSAVAALLGIAGFRGTVLPVYDLGMLLGKPKTAAPRWLAVAAAAPVAFAFEAFHGFLRERPEAIVSEAREGSGRHIREMLLHEVTRPIVDLPSVLDVLVNRGGSTGLS